MKRIPLTQGKFSVVDDKDFDRASRLKWYAHFDGRNWYARRGVYSDGKMGAISLHRFLLNPPSCLEVDHINGDGLDNRRSNLRICTDSENARNRKSRKGNKSGLKGVSWHTQNKIWQVSVLGKYVGCFVNKIDAAHAYDAVARKKFGEFARTNF